MIDLDRNVVKYDSTNLSDIEDKLLHDGFVQVQFFFDPSSSVDSLEQFFIDFIQKLGGTCLKHNEDKDSIVWHVRPMADSVDQPRKLARSQTDEALPFHTDCSYEMNPPEFLALFVIGEDQCGGGQLEIIRLADVLKMLSSECREHLLSEKVRINIPEEFRQSLEIDHIEGPILLDEERIRFRHDIISTVDRTFLDELNDKIQQVERYRPKLRKFSMILLNNQMFLHGRTKVLDRNCHSLRIRFDRSLPFDVYSIFDRTKLRPESLRFDNDFVDFLKEQHQELHSILRLIVKQYDQPTSLGEQIRQTFQFDAKIDRLIRELNSARPDYRLGLYRPDILFARGEQFRLNGKEFFQPKFCEINARFPLNGYFHAVATSPRSHSKLIEEVIDQVNFDRNKPVFILKSKETGWDVHLFIEFWRKKFGQRCEFVQPKYLKISNGNLIEEENGHIVEQFLFELRQEELVGLDEDILQHLIHSDRIKYFNDLRTIFLVHDKRLFTLLSNSTFLYALLGRPASTSFAGLFPSTWTIDRIPAYLKETMLNDRQRWLIKPNSLGKGEKISIGADVSFEQWRNELNDPSHRQWIVQEFCPLLEFKSMKIIGTLICANDRCFPLGVVRMAPKNIVNVVNGAAFARSWAPQRFEHRAKDGTILTKAELREQLIERRSTDAQWNRSVYLALSGGTGGGKRLYFATDIRENRRQREIFVRMLLRENVLNDRDVCLNVFHTSRLYRSMEITNDLCLIANATPIPMAADSSDEDLLQAIDEFQPNVLMGMPNRLMQFAHFLQSNDRRKVSFEKIIFAGEPLDAVKRQYLAKIFHCSLYLGFYGSAETGVFACQTKELSSTQMYLYPKELVQLEIVDEHIVVTNLVRQRNQLIRFNTGDQGRLLPYPADDRYGLVEVFRSQRLFWLARRDLAKSDIERIVQPLNFLEWQLIIEYLDERTRLLFRFSPSEEKISLEQVEQTIFNGFRQHFKENADEFLQQVQLEFESIEIDGFIRHPISNKHLKIIDRRS